MITLSIVSSIIIIVSGYCMFYSFANFLEAPIFFSIVISATIGVCIAMAIIIIVVGFKGSDNS